MELKRHFMVFSLYNWYTETFDKIFIRSSIQIKDGIGGKSKGDYADGLIEVHYLEDGKTILLERNLNKFNSEKYGSYLEYPTLEKIDQDKEIIHVFSSNRSVKPDISKFGQYIKPAEEFARNSFLKRDINPKINVDSPYTEEEFLSLCQLHNQFAQPRRGRID